MELSYRKPFHYEVEYDPDGVSVMWRIHDEVDAIVCFCVTEQAAKEIIERLNESV